MTPPHRPRSASPSAAEIEELLQALSSGTTGEPAGHGAPVVTTHALWLCACETFDEWETWVVHAVGEDGLGWFRLATPVSIEDVVEADHLAGHHPAPEGVLDWLRGDDPDPWRSTADDPEGAAVFAEIHRRIRAGRVADRR